MTLRLRFTPFAAALALVGGQAVAADAAHPLVLELFQSQGCSSCPPAEANLNVLADVPDVIALNFAVTYWDKLGWKDTFARPEFTQRQIAYAHALRHTGNVFTPNVVVNGQADGVGADPEALRALIAAHNARPPGPSVTGHGKVVSISAAPSAGIADVWLVRFDPRIQRVPIKAGENGGRTLPQRNIVRDLVRLGDWRGTAETLPLPAGDPTLKTAVLVQRAKGGPILAATLLK